MPLPNMNRREFVSSLVSVPMLGFIFPRALLGNPAGGFYAQVPEPDDMNQYVTWYPEFRPGNMYVLVTRALGAAAWIPSGQTNSVIQLFGGIVAMNELEAMTGRPGLLAARRLNLLNSLRTCMAEHHTPGWFLARDVITTHEPQGLNEDGEPYFHKSVDRWRRTDYVRWLKPDEWNNMRRAT